MSPRGPTPVEAPPAPATRVATALFYALLALVAVRPLIGESYERIETSFLVSLGAAGGAGPTHTAALDALTLLVSGAALARPGVLRRYRGALLALVGLLAAVLLAGRQAGDRPLALLAGVGMVVAALAGVALHSLLRQRWMAPVLVAALLATGGATAAKCLLQVGSEFPELAKIWQSDQKPRLLAQGFDPNDPTFVNFERRMASGAAYGYLSHSNVTGSVLMMAGLVALGLLIGVLFARRAPGARDAQNPARLFIGLVLTLLLAAGLAATRSRGAAVSAVVGAVLVAALARANAKPGRVLAAFVLGYGLLVAVGAAYGVARGTLPHTSLQFRWQYWTAAAEAWRAAPWTGVGRGNFGAAYLLHKAPQATEEVRDPHNIWLTLLVELGPLGLGAGVALAAVVLAAPLRRAAQTSHEQSAVAEPSDRPAAARTWARLWPLAACVVLAHALFSGTPLAQAGMPLLWLIETLAPWLALLAAGHTLARRDPAGARWLAVGALAAVCGGLLHALLDFTLSTPGGLAFFALCAAAAAARGPAAAEVPERGGWTAAGALAGAAALTLYVLRILAPTVQDDRLSDALNRALRERQAPERVAALLDELPQHSVGAEPARVAARTAAWYAQRSGPATPDRQTWFARAAAAAQLAIDRNPRDTGNYALLGNILSQAAQGAESPRTTQLAASAAAQYQHAVELYPTNPRGRLSAGQAWLAVWRRTGARDAAEQARANFTAARAIDATRKPEEVVRLRPAERAVLDAGLDELAAAQAAASAPTTAP